MNTSQRETSHLVQHEAHISLLAEAATQAVEDLETKSFVGSGVVPRMNVHLNLLIGFGTQLSLWQTKLKTPHVHFCISSTGALPG